jgi:hypothetical protein
VHQWLIELIGPRRQVLQGVEGEYFEAHAAKVEVKRASPEPH